MTTHKKTEKVADLFSDAEETPLEKLSMNDIARDEMKPSYKVHADWLEAAIRPVVEASGSNNAKGAYGEALMDRMAIKQMERRSLKGTNMAQASDSIDRGIDGLYEDPLTGEVTVGEAKYGKAQLGHAKNADGAQVKQMSDPWISKSRYKKEGTRLGDIVGEARAADIRAAGFKKKLFRS